jgi:hypothetical protein
MEVTGRDGARRGIVAADDLQQALRLAAEDCLRLAARDRWRRSLR